VARALRFMGAEAGATQAADDRAVAALAASQS
jgi:hypothetical protein